MSLLALGGFYTAAIGAVFSYWLYMVCVWTPKNAQPCREVDYDDEERRRYAPRRLAHIIFALATIAFVVIITK